MSKKDKTPEPMDPSITEQVTGTAATNTKRECWAIRQLVSEVHALFPETPVEYSDYDRRNTALSVAFDLTTLDSEDREMFALLMETLGTDTRVAGVVVDPDHIAAAVSIKPGPRTQDVRDSFGLADAFDILVDDEDGSR